MGLVNSHKIPVVAVEKGVSRVTRGRDGADNEEDMSNNDRLEQLIMEYLE